MPEKMAAIDRSLILKFGGDADSTDLKAKYFDWLKKYGEARLQQWHCWQLALEFPRENSNKSWFVPNGGSGPSREDIEREQEIQAEIAGSLPPETPPPAADTPPAAAPATVVSTTPTPPRTKPPGRPRKASPLQDGPVARGEVQQAIKTKQQLQPAG